MLRTITINILGTFNLIEAFLIRHILKHVQAALRNAKC